MEADRYNDSHPTDQAGSLACGQASGQINDQAPVQSFDMDEVNLAAQAAAREDSADRGVSYFHHSMDDLKRDTRIRQFCSTLNHGGGKYAGGKKGQVKGGKKGKKKYYEPPASSTKDQGIGYMFKQAPDMSDEGYQMALRYINHLNPSRNALLQQQPEGAFLCLSRQAKFKNPPKPGHARKLDFQWREYRTRMSNEEIARLCADQESLYLSVNTMSVARRRVANLENLNALYLDCDIYRTDPAVTGYHWDQMSDEQMVAAVLECCAKRDLPEPTMITHSGGGMYLIWAFEQPVEGDPCTLSSWKLAMKLLCAELEEPLGADQNAKDCARVLRVPGSFNCKYGEPRRARILHELPARYEAGHILEQCERLASKSQELPLMDACRAESNQQKREQNRIKRQRLAAEKEEERIKRHDEMRALGLDPEAIDATEDDADFRPNYRYAQGGLDQVPRTLAESRRLMRERDIPGNISALQNFILRRQPPELALGEKNLLSLNWLRFRDLCEIVAMRGGIRRGERDLFMFWMLVFLAHARVLKLENMNRIISELVMAFPISSDFDPLSDGSMNAVRRKVGEMLAGVLTEYKGALYTPLYTPSNDYMLDVFHVTEREQHRLYTLITDMEVQRRRDEKSGGGKRREERSEHISAVLAMAERGWSLKKMSQYVGKDPSTISRWINAENRLILKMTQSARDIYMHGNSSQWEKDIMQQALVEQGQTAEDEANRIAAETLEQECLQQQEHELDLQRRDLERETEMDLELERQNEMREQAARAAMAEIEAARQAQDDHHDDDGNAAWADRHLTQAPDGSDDDRRMDEGKNEVRELELRGRRSPYMPNENYQREMAAWRELRDSGACMRGVRAPSRTRRKTQQELENGVLSPAEQARRKKSHARAKKQLQPRQPMTQEQLDIFLLQIRREQSDYSQIVQAQHRAQAEREKLYRDREKEFKARLSMGRLRQRVERANSASAAENQTQSIIRNTADSDPAKVAGVASAGNQEKQHVSGRKQFTASVKGFHASTGEFIEF